MHGEGLFASLPIWAIFIITLLVVLLSIEGGYLCARYKQKRSGHEKEAPVGAMVGATLGFLAFLIAFTFSMAADGFQARRQAVLNEANAIGTTYLRAGLILEPHRAEVRKLLREYVEERLQWAGVEKAQVVYSAKELQNQLWAQAAAVGEKSSDSAVVALFIDSVNKMIDLRTERVLLRERSRVPGTFWAVLYVVAILGSAAMGYHGGVAGTTRSPVMLVVAIAFSVVIVLIADLDRPGQGLIKVSQQAMIDLRDSIARSKP
jgi:uncharacterized protein YqgC (DUF456 family)